MKFPKVLFGCFAAGVVLSGCSLFSASLDDKWFPADVVAPVGLPIYEVSPKDAHVPFFETADQVSTVAGLLEVDVDVVQASVDESLEGRDEHSGPQHVRIPITCDLPVESSLAAASFLHPGYVWKSTEIEGSVFRHAFGIDLAPGFDEVANTASASWAVTGAEASGIAALNDNNDCSFSLMDFRYNFEVVAYTDVSRSAVDARHDIERVYKLIFGSLRESAPREDYWLPARISFLMPMEEQLKPVSSEPYLVHPVFFVGGDEILGGPGIWTAKYAYAPVDPEVAAAEIRFLESL